MHTLFATGMGCPSSSRVILTGPGSCHRGLFANEGGCCYFQRHVDGAGCVLLFTSVPKTVPKPSSEGVVIGFVLSYRVCCGYDQYWMGRTAWSNVAKNIQTLSRLTWFHVPLRLTPKTPQELAQPVAPWRGKEEVEKVMSEKRMALELLEGYFHARYHSYRY